MNLSDEATTEFQEIYSKEFGKQITLDKAREYGNQLLELMKIFLPDSLKVYKPNKT